ncbi:hypothetical protein M9435_003924 [Picochlorum sp. BPE23]|nr:hypothetical protein M9435_003924 [Picochlorum sp. BPE23]
MSLRHGVLSVLKHASDRDEVVDEYVIDYVTALLESNTLEECQREDVEALEEGLRGLVEHVISDSNGNERGVDEVVEGLINLLRTESEDVSRSHEDDGSSSEEEELETRKEQEEKEDPCLEESKGENEDPSLEESKGEEKEEPTEDNKIDDDVSMLRSLLGLKALKEEAGDDEIQRRYIKRVLQSCSHDVHQAAEKLLQMQSTGELDIEMNIERKREVARKGPPSPLLDDALKATIVSKYHLQAVPSDPLTSTRKATTLKFPKGDEEGKNKKKAQIRFRDGAVVSTKGEKYIVENTLPEWDGGSRGRVKMKGKRGTGWV